MSTINETAPIPPTLHFKQVTYRALQPGPKVIITGAVHGTETCGTVAIQRFMRELDAHQHELVRGTLTLVPICNPLAYAKRAREGERNLNRNLSPTDEVVQFEDHVANWLCPLLAEHEILLDLHSFRSEGTAFVMFGPENNTGTLEPFAQAATEEALAVRLGVNRAVHGWLETYADGVARRRQRLADVMTPEQSMRIHPKFGVGTTEYMRSVGGCALTLECGQNEDPQAPEVGYRAILAFLRHLGLLAGAAPEPARDIETLCIYKVVDKLAEGDRFVRTWASFDPLHPGDLIAVRADGSELRAEVDGCILFPDVNAKPHTEWFYLVRRSDRLAKPRA
jgi:predicted deacylase